jgi:hypothetical protein
MNLWVGWRALSTWDSVPTALSLARFDIFPYVPAENIESHIAILKLAGLRTFLSRFDGLGARTHKPTRLPACYQRSGWLSARVPQAHQL